VEFRFYPLRFRFLAQTTVHFPPGLAGNTLRGALGSIFRRLACRPECVDARACPVRAACAYARTFEPSVVDAGPSGLADRPRPFVFRAAHLNGCTIPPGGRFDFGVNLFELRDPPIRWFRDAFVELAKEGIGPGRGRAALESMDDPWLAVLSLDPPARAVHCARVDFLTPTELKSDGQLVEEPDFGTLARRIRDRIGTLSALYGSGPLPIDFALFGERASAVRTVNSDLQRVESSRRSTRTGQTHPLGGFTGFAEYEGDLTEFIPLLEAAQFTGVGRQTTWGKGEIRVTGCSF